MQTGDLIQGNTDRFAVSKLSENTTIRNSNFAFFGIELYNQSYNNSNYTSN